MAAAIGAGDRPANHLADTICAGAGMVDTSAAASMTGAAAVHFARLAELGAPFDRTMHRQFLLSREAAHGVARVVRLGGERAGQAIMTTLIRAVVQASHVHLVTGLPATDLVVEAGRGVDVVVESADLLADAGGCGVILAPAVLFAGGGAADLYAVTTNPPRIRGQMLGTAAWAGAVIRDAEFIQFHPTAIDIGEDPAPLATEALRGEGAVLINALGLRFILAIAPQAEFAARDVVTRAVFAEWQAGRRPMLDTRAAIGASLPTLFATVHAACLRAGVGALTQPIPVTAAAHYHMGGVAVDPAGRLSVPGLWVAGEAACTGLRGANRLASNGLLKAPVLGRAAAMDIARAVALAAGAPVSKVALSGVGLQADARSVAILRGLMTRHVGVERKASGPAQALAGLAALDGANPPAFDNMLAAATLIAAAAHLRRESRGAISGPIFPKWIPDRPILRT